jgi:primosomal protein N'
MYIVSVIPIQRGIPLSTLTYFSTESLSAGTIVQVPLGKQAIFGIIYESVSLIEAKTNIKQATFSLKKITGVVGRSAFSSGLVDGLRIASSQTLTPIGALAGAMLNDIFFDSLQVLKDEVQNKVRIDPLCVYGPLSERIDQYKRIIRESFAQKKSVVLVAPSIRSTNFWYETLQKGIGTHSIILHSKRTKKDQKSSLALIKSSDRPLFIATTPAFAIIPREDISTIILEDESSALYKTHDRYEIDQRIVLESVAKSTNIRMVYGDSLPRFETLHKTASLHLARSFTPENLVVVPTEAYRTILPTETIELIRYCQKNKKSLFIYTNRKGIAPLSRCADCGTTVDCPTCGLPIVLRYKIVEGERQRLFICTHCGDTLPPTHVCTYCASWNIAPVSIGTDSLSEAVASIVGAENLITIDDDVTPDNKSNDDLIENIQKRKWFVMVGTQKLMPFIKNIDFIVMPFFDRLLSIPSPFVVEETLRLIMECNEKTKDSLILCTRNPEFSITKQLSTKKIQEIIDEDMEARGLLKYPPFGILLKLSVTVPNGYKDGLAHKVGQFFLEQELTMMPARRISQSSMKVLCVWIIQVDANYLEDQSEAIMTFLQELRLPNKIEINPSRL